MRTDWRFVLGVALLLALAGCASNDWRPDPEAQRLSARASLENAEANRIRAEGEAKAQVAAARIEAGAAAYRVEKQADAEAAERLSDLRQRERDAAHQRAMEMVALLDVVGWRLGLALALLPKRRGT